MARALLGLGSNQGCPRENFADALRHLASLASMRLLKRSRWHHTAPIGGPGTQDEFLNGCVLVQTAQPASELAAAIHGVENRMGREREVHWGPRTIDIDLLLYDQHIIHTPQLIVPHPRMSFRRFVLEPAGEIAPEMIDPTRGWTVARLLAQLNRVPRLVAVTAEDAENAQSLAAGLQDRIGNARLETCEDVSNRSDPGLPDRRETDTADSVFIVAGSEVPVEIAPALTIVWNHSDEDSDRIHSRGPEAIVSDSEFGEPIDQAVAAIEAAWPDLLPGKPN